MFETKGGLKLLLSSPGYSFRIFMALTNTAPVAAAQIASFDTRPAVRFWLIAVAGLVFLMVLVGGATRLTESGLSITQWKPVTGVLPPLSEAEWQAEFDRYKQIPQFAKLNADMTLGRVQGHLLVGVGASAAGAHRRRGVRSARLMVLVARPAQGRARKAGRRSQPACLRSNLSSAGGW